MAAAGACPDRLPGLDLVLQGGFFRGDMYLLVGAPGAGKTVLANQICFSHVAGGGQAVYITLLSESHVRMLAHLQTFPFFQVEVLADTLNYFSAFHVLEEEGLPGLLSFLRTVVRERRATLLVIDALMPIQEIAPSALGFSRFLHDLGTLGQLAGCTMLLLAQRQGTDHPEYTILDGIVDLDYQLVDTQAVRELQLLKFRGSGHLTGRHGFEISDAGITVHPRTEARYGAPAAGTAEGRSRMRFGIPQLDEMLGGGVMSGTSTVLLGPSGSGKTLLGLHFLASGARDGQRGLLFGFYETPVRLIGKANELGLGFGQLVARDEVEILWQAPLGEGLDLLAERLLDGLARRSARRLFIDGIEGFQQAANHSDRFGRFLIALVQELRVRDVTTVVSSEQWQWPAPAGRSSLDAFVPVADNIIQLRRVELRSRAYRLLSIHKQQESRHDTALREFSITGRGLEVASGSESAEAILAGRAPSAPAAPAGTPSRLEPRQETQQDGQDDAGREDASGDGPDSGS